MKYYTVIVVKIDAFESQIINERHFGNYEDAEEFLCMLPYKYEHHCTLKEFPVPEHQENFRLWPAPWLILYNIRKSC